jgi:glutathione synthase/RimK-type ligase-like ATP-grasp enzyme
MPNIDVGFVSCLVLPEPDVDEQLFLPFANEAGLTARIVSWDDPNVDWSAFRCIVLRSTWDYHLQIDKFRDWLALASEKTIMYNDAKTIGWNIDKAYLSQLESAGIPIVPTEFISPSESVVEALDRRPDWTGSEFVVKPTISAGSYQTYRIRRSEAADIQPKTTLFGPDRKVMIQPFVSSVDRGGEASLIYIDREFSHCIIKSARFDGEHEVVTEAVSPEEPLLSLAERVLDELDDELLYARIDLMRLDDGSQALSELELIEPSLFFKQCPQGLRKLVSAIRSRLD